MKKYDPRKYLSLKTLFEVDEVDQQQAQSQTPQNATQSQQAAPAQPQSSPNDAFRSLQGQTVAGVQFAPNGGNGGTIKIKVKDSYVPFTISWVNQKITVVDLQGNTIVLGDNQQ